MFSSSIYSVIVNKLLLFVRPVTPTHQALLLSKKVIVKCLLCFWLCWCMLQTGNIRWDIAQRWSTARALWCYFCVLCIIHSQCCGSLLTPCFPHYVNILISSFLHGYICRTFERWIRERAYGLVRPEKGWSLLCRHCIDCSVSHTLSCWVQEERNVTSFTSLFIAVSLQVYVSV